MFPASEISDKGIVKSNEIEYGWMVWHVRSALARRYLIAETNEQ